MVRGVSVIDGCPCSVLGWEVTTSLQIYLNFLVPTCIECLVYIIHMTADVSVGVQHFQDKDVIWGSVTLFLVFLPAITNLLFISSSPLQWPEEKGFGKENCIFVIKQIYYTFLFPIAAIYRFCRRIFWSVESLHHHGKERQYYLKKSEERSPLELYHFLQAYLQAAPQIIVQFYILFRKDMFRNYDTLNLQALSIAVSIIKMSMTTMSYQRFESQKIVGRAYPWHQQNSFTEKKCQNNFENSLNSVESLPELDKINIRNSPTDSKIRTPSNENRKTLNVAPQNFDDDGKKENIKYVAINSTDDEKVKLYDTLKSQVSDIENTTQKLLESDTDESVFESPILLKKSEQEKQLNRAESIVINAIVEKSMTIDETDKELKDASIAPVLPLKGVQPLPPERPVSTISSTSNINNNSNMSNIDDPPNIPEKGIIPEAPERPISINERYVPISDCQSSQIDTISVELRDVDRFPDMTHITVPPMSKPPPRPRNVIPYSLQRMSTFKNMIVHNAETLMEEIPKFKAYIRKTDEVDSIPLPSRVKRIYGIEQEDVVAKLVSSMSWFFFIISRMVSLSTFAFYYVLPCVYLCLSNYFLFLFLLLLQSKCRNIYRTYFYLFLSYIYIFVILEFKIKFQKIRYWYVGYVLFIFAQNIAMTLVWYHVVDWTSFWFDYIFGIVIGSTVLSLCCMILYIYLLKPKDKIIPLTDKK